jgi:replicative DNA helicase
MESSSKQPFPNDTAAEMSVLGAAMLEPKVAAVALSRLNEEDFYRGAHSVIFAAMRSVVIDDRHALDPVTLRAKLAEKGQLDAVGGQAYLMRVGDFVPGLTVSQANAYIDTIKDRALARGVLESVLEIQSKLAAGEIATGKEALAALETGALTLGKAAGSLRARTPIADAVIEALNFLTGGVNAKTSALPLGVSDFDKSLIFKPGALTVIAAASSEGKSSLALQWARNCAEKHAKNVMIASLEMPGREIAARFVFARARVSSSRAEAAGLSPEETTRLAQSAREIAALPIEYVDEPDLTANSLFALARQAKLDGVLDMLVVDYVQLLEPGGGAKRYGNREQEVAATSRLLKRTAQELDIGVIGISQLNENGDARESRAIFNDADNFVQISATGDERNGIRPVKAEIRKQRSGPRGVAINLSFNAAQMEFTAQLGYGEKP